MLEGIIGFLAGIISSMGFGGGSILLVYLTLFAGVSQKEAAGINLIYFLPCAAAATFFFFKTKFIEKEPVIRLAICSAIGAVAGSVGAIFIDDKIIRIVFAVVLLGVGLKELFSKPKKKPPQEQMQRQAPGNVEQASAVTPENERDKRYNP